MRPTQSTGRPGTPVIPPNWTEAPRTVAVKTMTATCTIRRPGGTQGAFDATTGTYPTTPHTPHYTGPCRVQVQPIFSGQRDTADQQVTVAGYLVVVELEGSDETGVDDVVKITSPGEHGDPAMLDREMVVSGIAVGSLAWERDLTCIDNLG